MRDEREGSEVRERTERDVPSCKGWGLGTPRSLEGDRQGGAEGVPIVGDSGATWGGGARKESAAQGTPEGEKSWARGTGRGKVRSREKEMEGCFFWGGVPDKGGDGKVREEGETGGSLKMGVGEFWRAARGAGKLGVPGRASEPREPLGRHGGRPRTAAGRARGESRAGGGGERPSQERAGGES